MHIRLFPDALQISLDKTAKKVEAYIKYPFIKCLNPYGPGSFYMKSNKFGYAMIFAPKYNSLGQRFLKNLRLLLDQDEPSQKIFQLDVTHKMPKLKFAEKTIRYKFSYDKYYDEMMKNPAKLSLLKAKEPKDLGLNFEFMNIDI